MNFAQKRTFTFFPNLVDGTKYNEEASFQEVSFQKASFRDALQLPHIHKLSYSQTEVQKVWSGD